MFMQIINADNQLESLGLTLPPPPKPLGVYKPCLVDGKYLYVSGHGTVQADGSIVIPEALVPYMGGVTQIGGKV
mgnify:CR=1 FL=1